MGRKCRTVSGARARCARLPCRLHDKGCMQTNTSRGITLARTNSTPPSAALSSHLHTRACRPPAALVIRRLNPGPPLPLPRPPRAAPPARPPAPPTSPLPLPPSRCRPPLAPALAPCAPSPSSSSRFPLPLPLPRPPSWPPPSSSSSSSSISCASSSTSASSPGSAAAALRQGGQVQVKVGVPCACARRGRIREEQEPVQSVLSHRQRCSNTARKGRVRRWRQGDCEVLGGANACREMQTPWLPYVTAVLREDPIGPNQGSKHHSMYSTLDTCQPTGQQAPRCRPPPWRQDAAQLQ